MVKVSVIQLMVTLSINDWGKKISRGSAAVDHQWYAEDVRANKYFGEYNIPDFTMLETKKLMGI